MKAMRKRISALVLSLALVASGVVFPVYGDSGLPEAGDGFTPWVWRTIMGVGMVLALIMIINARRLRKKSEEDQKKSEG